MKLNLNDKITKAVLGVVLGATLGLVSCNREPDKSDLYTFTGQTIQDYLEENDSVFHLFNVIMNRSGYDRMMDAYGDYTCYAPVNSGVEKYIDSLYNDPEAKEPHNGMTENSVYGLTDEQCKEIAMYHLSSMVNSYVDVLSNYSGKEVTTMQNTPFISKLGDDGVVRFNGVARVLFYDQEMTNGFVHIISDVIPRTTRRIAEVLEEHPEFSLFFEAAEKCGLLDSLAIDKKTNADGSPRTYHLDNITGRPASNFTALYHVPTECKVKFTIFAEDSTAFAREGIYTFEDLKEKCVEWYGGAAAWYRYPNMAAHPISTGDDYENPYNVVNMFIRYHIITAGMSVSKLLYERNTSNENWNFAFGGEPFDYYETMLPHTLMKIWQPLYQPTGASNNIWINRWRNNNTLTDEIGTFGSEATHQIVREGCMVVRAKSNIQSYNGYIHTLDRPLVYDANVPNGVLHERLRIDLGSVLHELINNDIRFATATEIAAMNVSSSDGTMTRLPLDYFDHLISYNTKTKLAWYTQGAWRSWESDKLAGWDENDFAFRLPPVPTGDYEIRTLYSPMPANGLQQYYIGTSTDPSSMQPLGIPVDARYPDLNSEADRISSGYLMISEYDDYGVASDLIMRTHGLMRAPASFSRGTYNQIKERISSPEELIANPNNCSRYEQGSDMMRKILGTFRFEQDKEYWIRMKNLLVGYDQLGFGVDYIELVPLDIVNNQDYAEDWY